VLVKLITHSDVNLISFTGSTLTGYHIKKATAHLPVKLSLEVGEERVKPRFEFVFFL